EGLAQRHRASAKWVTACNSIPHSGETVVSPIPSASSKSSAYRTISFDDGISRPAAGRASDVKKAAQAAGPARVRKFSQRFSLDLADALAGDREPLADLLQRVIGVHADAEAHAHDV